VASAQDRRSDDTLALAVEIGGRGQRAAIITGAGRIIDAERAIGQEQTAIGTVETVTALIEQLLARRGAKPYELQGIGIAFGGPVDVHRGVTIRSHRINGFEQFPLVSVLEDRFGIHTVLENDARAAAFGEYAFGAGRGARDMVYIHLGSGVGGAVIIDGKLEHGASMTAGEFGHMVVSLDGPRCSCGKPGHLEAYASEAAIVQRMRTALLEAGADATANWLTSSGITVKRIFDRYELDATARAVVDETIQVIGLAAANLVTALNPDAVVIGGHVAEAAPSLTASIRSKIRQYAFDAAARRVAVASSQLGADAGIVGAVTLALRR
jgi:glucokinase